MSSGPVAQKPASSILPTAQPRESPRIKSAFGRDHESASSYRLLTTNFFQVSEVMGIGFRRAPRIINLDPWNLHAR